MTEAHYWVMYQKDGTAAVAKMVPGRDGVYLVPAKVYSVQHGNCSCEGFQHRHACKHLEMIGAEPVGRAMGDEEARAAASALCSFLTPFFAWISAKDDWAVRNVERLVIRVRLSYYVPKDAYQGRIVGDMPGGMAFELTSTEG